jgi:hypothetical protein
MVKCYAFREKKNKKNVVNNVVILGKTWYGNWIMDSFAILENKLQFRTKIAYPRGYALAGASAT